MTASQRPEVSVIVAVRNAAATIERCIRSIPAAAEVVVVDGASTDGTVDIIRSFEGRMAWWCSERDGGVYPAWNKALQHVSGAWILFLGADDWIDDRRGWTEVVGRLRSVGPGIRIAYGGVRLVSPSGREITIVGDPWEQCGRRLRRSMALPHQGVFHRRELFLDRGIFDESFAIAGDYEFLLRELLRAPAHFLGSTPVITNMSVGGLSLRGTRVLEHVREIRRAREKHGVFEPDLEYRLSWARAALRGVMQRMVGESISGRLADGVRRAMGRPPVWSVR